MAKNHKNCIMKSLTPNIMVNDVNETLKYYREYFDFKKVMTVPEEGKLDWAMMKKDHVALMFEKKESLASEIASLQNKPLGATMTLYIDTDNIDGLYRKIKDYVKIIKEPSVTFYGAKEFTIEDLNGYLLTFAEHNE